MHNNIRRQDSLRWEATMHRLSIDVSLLPETVVPFYSVYIARCYSRSTQTLVNAEVVYMYNKQRGLSVGDQRHQGQVTAATYESYTCGYANESRQMSLCPSPCLSGFESNKHSHSIASDFRSPGMEFQS